MVVLTGYVMCVCVCVCVGCFVLVICVLLFTVFCIVSFMYIYSCLFCLYWCKDSHRVKTQLQLVGQSVGHSVGR